MAKAKKTAKKAAKKVIKKTVKKVTKKSAKKTVKKSVKKTKKVLAIPKGYHSITPYLIVKHGMKAIEFYKKAFNAKVIMCMPSMTGEAGKVGHAELQIGDSKFMMGDISDK